MSEYYEPGMKYEPDWAALVGLQRDGESEAEAAASLAELERLVDSAGAHIVCSKVVRLRKPNPATLLGTGRLEELYDWGHARDCDIFVIDDDFSPVQQRNLEKHFGCPVLTRTQVILDIFAQHARTREAQVQVELAQLRYNMPRLIGAGIATAKGGGTGARIATRGPGEKQLEVDRRKARIRVQKLERQLAEINAQRETQRRRRMRKPLPLVGIVGYTNAGKSTLLNRLTEADILAEDRLFATLDTTVRVLKFPGGLEAGLIDTVGFVNKLPPTLVAAFRSTLEEIQYADLILHVVDASSARRELEAAATRETLEQLGCIDTPRLRVYNKIDLIDDDVRSAGLTLDRPEDIAISALTGQGIPELVQRLERLVMEQGETAELLVPYDDYALVARLHRESQVLEDRDTSHGKRLRVRLPAHLDAPARRYEIEPGGKDDPLASRAG